MSNIMDIEELKNKLLTKGVNCSIIYEITDNVRTRNVSVDIIVDSFIREYNKLINTHPSVRIDLYKYNDKRISYALTMT